MTDEAPPLGVLPPMTIAAIQQQVANYFDMPLAEMKSARQTRNVARPRQVAMTLAREITGQSMEVIGAKFGGRDHTTVLHAIKQVEKLSAAQPEFARAVADIRHELIGGEMTIVSMPDFAKALIAAIRKEIVNSRVGMNIPGIELFSGHEFSFEGVKVRGAYVNVDWSADKWRRWFERCLQTIHAYKSEHSIAWSGDKIPYPDPAGAVSLRVGSDP